MNKVGIELNVETGGFISGIASAERSIESLTKAMKQAKDEGRDEDFVRLQIQRDTLAASTSGFKQDTQKLFSTPGLQTTTSSGATVLKMDSDQATVFKDLNTTIKKLTSVYVDQINNNDFQGRTGHVLTNTAETRRI
jgi:nitrogenase subunit NifH